MEGGWGRDERGRGGTIGRRLLRQKPLPITLPKTSVGIGRLLRYGGGRYTKKGAMIPDTSKLAPGIFALFFCAHCAPDGCRHRPAALVVCCREERRFAAAKRAGIALRARKGGNAPCEALHLIRHGDAMTPSPQGEGFWLIAVKQTSPRSQREIPPAGGLPLVFSAEKTAYPRRCNHSTPTVWQAWPAQPVTRVKRAEKERESCGSSLLVSGPFPLFFTKACQTAVYQKRRFLCFFLFLKKETSPSFSLSVSHLAANAAAPCRARSSDTFRSACQFRPCAAAACSSRSG